jgi:hypothetical protein
MLFQRRRQGAGAPGGGGQAGGEDGGAGRWRWQGRAHRAAAGELRQREGQGVVERKKMEEDGRRKEKKKEKEEIFLEYAILQFSFRYLFCAMHFNPHIAFAARCISTPILHLQVDPNCVLQFRKCRVC